MESDIGGPLQREVRDGVPVYWTPKAPRVVGAVMFRAGYSDEAVTLRGITHFVEHLALFEPGAKPKHDLNGFVDGMRAVFWASGTAEQVVTFLERVCSRLANLPLHRLETESRVLRTEASTKQPGTVEKVLWYRFGARGHGLVFVPEFLLEAPDPRAIREWSVERFTIENATAWFSGPIPDDLHFDMLPRGRRFECLEATPIPGLRTPAFLCENSGGVGISFVTERDDWISLPWAVATERLMARLRFEAGLTYAVQCGFQHVSGHQTHSVIWAGCLEDQAMKVQSGLLEVLEELAHTGPTDSELEEIRRQWNEHEEREENVFDRLDTAALNELVGYPVRSANDHREDFEGRSKARWAESVQRALQSSIVVLPFHCTPSRSDLTPSPMWSETVATGRKYRAAAQRFPWSKKHPALIVGKSGVSVVTPEGRAVTVFFDNCAGAVVQPDGTLQLFSEDGFAITIAAPEWRGGDDARSEALRSLPLDRLIHLPRR